MRFRAAALCALGLIATVFVSPVMAAQTATATVNRVVDGDTVDLRLPGGSIERVRLIGLNTPETVDPRQPVQCFGQEASQRAHELLDGQTVTLELDASQGERDRYGRLLGYVYLPNGQNFAEVMIGEGFGHEYTYALPYAYQEGFRTAQTSAQTNAAGLWSPTACAGQLAPTDLDDDAVVQPDPMVPPVAADPAPAFAPVVAPPPAPPTVQAQPAPSTPDLCGAPQNPWNFTYCGSGQRITTPPSTLCSVFACIPSFWNQTRGYVMQCRDGLLSHSGGIQGSCSSHGGNSRPLLVS